METMKQFAPHIRRSGLRKGRDEAKKTIIVYSPDLDFCFSMSMLFQDQYNVVTTTDLATLEAMGITYSANLAILDSTPSEKLIGRLKELRVAQPHLPIIIVYVCSAREMPLDAQIREQVDSVFYKPFEISAVCRRVEELIAD